MEDWTVADTNSLKERNLVKPTLETLSPSQIEAIRKIPAHNEARIPQLDAQKPVSMFTGQEQFENEMNSVFQRQPIALTVSALLKPGHVMAHDGYGVPLLISRDKQGVAHVFLNACQHKGAKLIEGCDVHKRNLVTCPYHAWSYTLSGDLAAVAREETFANFDKDTRRLTEMPCREFAGMIWTILDRESDPDWSNLHPQVDEDFKAMRIDKAHVYGRRQFPLNANWKVVLEPFLEGYHVQRLHARSIGSMFADTPNITETFGPNIRQISGKVNFTPEVLVEEADENIHKTVTHAYEVFPNVVVVTSPYYISLMIIMPRAAGKSVVDYFMLTPVAPDNEKAEALYSKSYELIQAVFGKEDFWAAEMSQEGLESGALKTVVYSGLEETIMTFYDILDRQMAV